MTPTTKAQRIAIRKLHQRHQPLASNRTAQDLVREAGWRFYWDESDNTSYWWHPNLPTQTFNDAQEIVEAFSLDQRQSYRAFRKTVRQGHDCLMVNVSGMWVGIETNGYTHT